MAITAGDFSPSQLATALTHADTMWTDDMRQADFRANAQVLEAIRAEQNADVTILQDPEKDREVKVHWVNMCGETAQDCTTSADDCDLSGNELGSDDKTYALGECKEWSFTVDEMKFRNNNLSMEEVVAAGLLKGDKALTEAMTATAMARIESWKGENLVGTSGPGTWDAVNTQTDIDDADWNASLFAYLYRMSLQNELSNPFLLTGENLFEDDLIAQMSRGNGEGKGAAALYNMMRKYYDLFNIDPANGGAKKTYMINRGSIAFASKAYYSEVPTRYKQQDRYSIASRNLEGVRFDVFYTNRCSAKTMLHDFKMVANYDLFLNPTGCQETRTGILAFNRTGI